MRGPPPNKKYFTEADRIAALKAASDRYYEKNKDFVKAKSKERYEKFTLRARYMNWRARLKRLYGITSEQYNEILISQGGVCAICHGPPSRGDDGFVVDHDHLTKRVRGLLCHACNSALGLLLDDPEVIRRALEYISGR